MTVVDSLNGFAERGFDWAAASLVEASLLLVLAGLVLYLAGRRVSPAAAHLLLILVLVKAVFPLGIPAPRIELPNWSEQVAVMDTAPQEAVTPSTAVANVNEPVSVATAVVPTQTPQPPGGPLSAVQPSAFTPQLTWKAWAMLTWAVVALGLAIRRVHAQWKLRLAIRSVIPFDESLVELVRELALRVGIRRPIAVISGPNSIAPAVAGMWRPTLIVPRDLPQQLRAEQLRWVLLHELAHIRRGDLYTLWLVAAAECLTFFNPAVWVAARWTEYFRECACDELAWRHANCERSACGEAFLAMLAPAATRPSHALGFRSTQGQMRRRLLRLLEPAPRDRRRAAAVAIACVAVCGVFSVTQDASRAEGEVRVASSSSSSEDEDATKVDKVVDKSAATDHFARTEADIERIWGEQTRPIHSGRIVLNQLRLSLDRKNPLQQGHELKRISKPQVDAFLNSIEFRTDPNCLRKVRDGLLEGNLILDQPSAQSVEIIWNGDANRWNWPGHLTMAYEGKNHVRYDFTRRQVDVYAGHRADPGPMTYDVADYYAGERWRMLLFSMPPQMAGMHRYDRRPALRAVESLDGGLRRVEFDNTVHLRNVGEVRMPLAWTLDKDGQLECVDECFQNHVRRQVGYQEYPGNIVAPRVGIDAEYSYKHSPEGDIEYGNLIGITVTMLEQAEFNLDVPPEAFRVAVPANTAVWDRRGELKLRAAEQPVADVLTLFDR